MLLLVNNLVTQLSLQTMNYNAALRLSQECHSNEERQARRQRTQTSGATDESAAAARHTKLGQLVLRQ